MGLLINYGDYDRSLCILHKCDNPACVNPDHLCIGTIYDNVTDRNKKKRTAKGVSIKRSVFNEDQIIEIRNKYKSGIGVYKLSLIYNVTNSAISKIVNFKNWKHVM